LKFIFSFYGLVDLLAILPFYLSFGVDLRTLRAFRLLRLFKILRLPKYARAIRRIRLALALIKEELILFLSLSGVLLYLSSVGIYYFEHAAQPEVFTSVLHSLWWSLITLTTVGYGDMYPITAGGKLFTFAVLLVGLGIISIPAGLIASALSEARDIAEDQAAVNRDSEDQATKDQADEDQGYDDQKGAEPSIGSVKPDQ
jgi:voltage-gated potassium channel